MSPTAIVGATVLGTGRGPVPGGVAILDADPLADPENHRRVRAVLRDGAAVGIPTSPHPRVPTEEEP